MTYLLLLLLLLPGLELLLLRRRGRVLRLLLGLGRAGHVGLRGREQGVGVQ